MSYDIRYYIQFPLLANTFLHVFFQSALQSLPTYARPVDNVSLPYPPDIFLALPLPDTRMIVLAYMSVPRIKLKASKL